MEITDMTPCVSENLSHYGVDKAGRKLHVVFRKAPSVLYTWFNVPPKRLTAFERATSKGRFLKREIEPLFKVRRTALGGLTAKRDSAKIRRG